MPAKPMPGKLIAVVLLMIVGVIANLITGELVSAGIAVALIVGVVAGNDGVRTFLRGLALVQILWNLTFVLAVSHETAIGASAIALLASFGVAVPAFYFWALGQADVRDWMFRKNFKLDDPPSL